MVKSMADTPIIFALANPDPEILPEEVQKRVANFPEEWQDRYFGELATPSEYPLSWLFYPMRVGQLVYPYIKEGRQKVDVYMSYTLGAAYGISSGIVVDTHVGRVSRRLGLTSAKDPADVEKDLCALVPKRSWILTSHQLVLHGRYLCKAKKPDCAACPLAELCDSAEEKPKGRWGARADAEQARIVGAG